MVVPEIVLHAELFLKNGVVSLVCFACLSSFVQDTWWLDQCGLTPGSSGGPWLTDFNPDHPETSGKIVAVNSYGFANRPGMGAAMVDASAARCLANAARNADYKALAALPAGEEGLLVNCYDRPCVTDDGTTGRKRQLRGMNERNLCQKEGGK